MMVIDYSKGRLIIKKARFVIDDNGRRRLVSRPRTYFVPSIKGSFQTESSSLTPDDLSKPGLVKKGKDEFLISPAGFKDFYKRIRRGAQIIVPKDLGFIIVEGGLNNDSVVVEAGIGSGAATVYLSMIAKKVYSIDISNENLSLARENLSTLGVPDTKYSLLLADIYDPDNDSFKELEEVADLFLLDVPDPVEALKTVFKILKPGGTLLLYTPHITQSLSVINELSNSFEDRFLVEKVVELIEREWRVGGKMARPVTKDFGHTAFLSVIKKLF